MLDLRLVVQTHLTKICLNEEHSDVYMGIKNKINEQIKYHCLQHKATS